MSTPRNQPGFWRTVRILLGSARRRSKGRRRRQQQLLNNKSGGDATDWGGIGTILAVLLMLLVNGAAAYDVGRAVDVGQRANLELHGWVVVSNEFMPVMRGYAQLERNWRRINHHQSETPAQCAADSPYIASFRVAANGEARETAERFGGSQPVIQQRIVDAFYRDGMRDFVPERRSDPGLRALARTGQLAPFVGSALLLLWIVMLVTQGEGLELDLQRRRHPMWEWMLSHPAPPGAIFFAEMLSPIAANPIYWSAPLFVGMLYGFVFGPGLGALAALLIGFPAAIVAACMGKALEIAIVLRLPPRSRGAMVGLMSWAGYATMMGFIVSAVFVPQIVTGIGRPLAFLAKMPSPWLGWLLGVRAQGPPVFLHGLLVCWLAAAVTLAGSIWFSVWAANQGLSGNFAADSGPSRRAAGKSHFSSRPLYRKEMLWFLRDRSAIVQTILIPITLASFQLFNLRGLLEHSHSWNALSGAAIFFGTYFLWILGPKSLASEGNALWMALTWPTGLESLLKAKAWLWSLLSSAMVALVLAYAVFLYPADWWKVALIAVAWFLFGRSMAEKAVTLVTVTSDSGEIQKIPTGRRMAAQLGMFTFAIGVITQQWHIAAMGIVYSWLTAAAMWQNFRARLPFLYDPWSETLPPPPTLMHAMVSISILVEVGAILTGVLFVFIGGNNIAIAQAFSYGICSVGVSLATANFLSDRGIRPRDIWTWLRPVTSAREDADDYGVPWYRALGFNRPGFVAAVCTGIGGGLALGLFAHGYIALLWHLPYTAEILRRSRGAIAKISDFKLWYGMMAVGFAPFAEEYLFRGLLFRALDREWGGWRAILGSAAFFAFYHPPLAWVPVFLLGTANALLFKRSRSLIPCVLLHMSYNAVVIAWS